MKKREVEYLDYLPTEWDRIFKKEYNNIHFLLPDMKIYVEHIGATSINGCRSFRNVDVLVSTQNFADIFTAKMLLCIDEYKELPELNKEDMVVLIRKKKYGSIGVTVRIVEYGSETYLRFIAFKNILHDDYERVLKYNHYRELFFKQVDKDIKKYNEDKYLYINNLIDENWKLEK